MTSIFNMQNCINLFLVCNNLYFFWYTSQLKKECIAILLENTELKTEILQLKTQNDIFPILFGIGAFVLVLGTVFTCLYFGPFIDSKAIIESSHISNGLQLNSMTEQINELASGLSKSLNLLMDKVESIAFILTLIDLKKKSVAIDTKILPNSELIQPDEACKLLESFINSSPPF